MRGGCAQGVLVQAAPLLVPLALLALGGAVGLAFTLNPPAAWERLLGLLGAGAVGLATLFGLRAAPDRRLPAILLAGPAGALLAGLWVIAASGPGTFRGPIGQVLDRAFAPILGAVVLTDPWWATNTRFVVGYNGLADLSLVAVWLAAGVLLARPARRTAVAAAALLALGLVLLVGTSSRGALVGLLAGLATVGLLGWTRGWLLALGSAPLVLAMALLGALDKGLDLTSTTGRLAFWQGYVRLLREFPLTGVGLGLDTANAVARLYEVNPDPERIYYAHNTFIQTYMELGPLGMVGMLALPLLALAAALGARPVVVSRARRGLLLSSAGLLVALEVHGLTDQVVTTNVGTALVFAAAAMLLASLPPTSLVGASRLAGRLAASVALALAALLLAGLALPPVRAQVLVNLGSLQLSRAMLSGEPVDRRQLALAEGWFEEALALSPDQPAVLRGLAWARLERFDAPGALAALQQAAASPRLDPFDMLQVARAYRALGFGDEAYGWATRAFEAWGRAPPEPVLREYKRATLADNPAAITLAEQGEAALRARRYGEALDLFRQALALAPESAYLRERLGDAARGVERYGPQGPATPP